MNAVVEFKETNLPPAVARRGISEVQWRTAMNSLFPGAKGESVLMVFDYCMARKLDPLKKPCHIVPMRVKVGPGKDDYAMRDVVMPGIYEYRTTATRTGEYLGHSKPVYGPVVEVLGVTTPEYCEMTVYRWNAAAKRRCEFPVMVYFRECVATKKDWNTKEIVVNERWSKAPIQMLTKCTEAAGLREAFPDELGGEHTAEEMEGQNQTEQGDITQPSRVDPREGLEHNDWELRDKHISVIADIIAEYGSDEDAVATKLADYEQTHLARFPELYTAVNDKMAADGIISKKAFREYVAKGKKSF